MKRVLITGIGGSIATHFLEHFLENTDWDIVGVDSFRHKGWTDRTREIVSRFHDAFGRVSVFNHDLTAPISPVLRSRMGRIDYIINMASLSDVDASIKDPVPFVKNNIDLALTMLEFARVVVRGPDGRRYLRPSVHIPAIVSDTYFFDDFSGYTPSTTSAEAFQASVENWLEYATRQDHVGEIEEHAGAASTAMPDIPEVAESALDQVFAAVRVDTAAIGSHGEAIAITHERNRLRSCGRQDLARRVRKMPDHLGVGYDLESFECDGRPRCVEVKTTQSVSEVHFRSFHLTTNEWLKAEALGSSYVVYRLSLSDALGARLQTLPDPVGLYKDNKIQMIPREGADITFNNGVAAEVELMLSGE